MYRLTVSIVPIPGRNEIVVLFRMVMTAATQGGGGS